MPRNTAADAPKEVKAVASALLALSYKDGMTRAKIAGSPVLLALTKRQLPEATDAERARLVEDMIRTQTNSISNHRDRALTSAGLNLDQNGEPSFEARINKACDFTIGKSSPHFLEPESAQGRFRYQLTVELAWRLLGGPPTYAAPRPPSNELELAERLRRQHRESEAVPLLTSMASNADNEQDRRDAWRLLATIAYERGDYDATEMAFTEALHYTEGTIRGGKLAMAVDRYARRLTDEEEYERALAIVNKALGAFFEGRWLWRRYGCIKWYACELLDAYAALTVALDLGYPASRVFHARGQVLAELGRYDAAIAELSEALRVPRSSISIAQAKSARALALGMAGDLKASLAEFDSASETIPESGWLWYWRALCLRHGGRSEEAVAALERSLIVDSPRLPNPRRNQALRLIDSEVGRADETVW